MKSNKIRNAYHVLLIKLGKKKLIALAVAIGLVIAASITIPITVMTMLVT